MKKERLTYKEDNKLICDFMEFEKTGLDGYKIALKPDVTSTFCNVDYLEFQNHWGWIMPVWSKIMTIYNKDFIIDRVDIGKSTIFMVVMHFTDKWETKHFHHSIISTDKDETDMISVYYRTVVDFIKWYNLNIKIK